MYYTVYKYLCKYIHNYLLQVVCKYTNLVERCRENVTRKKYMIASTPHTQNVIIVDKVRFVTRYQYVMYKDDVV